MSTYIPQCLNKCPQQDADAARSRWRSAFFVVGITLLSLTSALRGDTLTVGDPNVEGTGTLQEAPFFAGQPLRFQQIYNSSLFMEAAPAGAYITEIRFRPDGF